MVTSRGSPGSTHGAEKDLTALCVVASTGPGLASHSDARAATANTGTDKTASILKIICYLFCLLGCSSGPGPSMRAVQEHRKLAAAMEASS